MSAEARASRRSWSTARGSVETAPDGPDAREEAPPAGGAADVPANGLAVDWLAAGGLAVDWLAAGGLAIDGLV
ncbi:hypothetical protein, partial [Arsenicicoccus bolidensis]|uniref:hypothetical protein n=1 Tax=Arsenicicoccus bolidensis TaxID=229480 RepID=UPI0028AD2E0B